MKLAKFPRIRLGHGPTPLEPMKNLSRLLGGPDLWIKRDDCTGLASGGNKTRKLEYLMADALAQGADTVITQGATQSNHARQTVAAACRLGAAVRAAGWPAGAVGVLLPNDARYLVGMFGCLAAGRPCMLLAPHQPPAFLAATVAAAGLVGVIATPELAGRLGGAVPVLEVTDIPSDGRVPAPVLLPHSPPISPVS